MNIAVYTVGLNLLLFTLHYICIQLYSNYCVPYGIKNFIYSLVHSSSPFCIGLNYLQFYSIELYYTLWMTLVISLLKIIKESIESMKKKIMA